MHMVSSLLVWALNPSTIVTIHQQGLSNINGRERKPLNWFNANLNHMDLAMKPASTIWINEPGVAPHLMRIDFVNPYFSADQPLGILWAYLCR